MMRVLLLTIVFLGGCAAPRSFECSGPDSSEPGYSHSEPHEMACDHHMLHNFGGMIGDMARRLEKLEQKHKGHHH